MPHVRAIIKLNHALCTYMGGIGRDHDGFLCKRGQEGRFASINLLGVCRSMHSTLNFFCIYCYVSKSVRAIIILNPLFWTFRAECEMLLSSGRPPEISPDSKIHHPFSKMTMTEDGRTLHYFIFPPSLAHLVITLTPSFLIRSVIFNELLITHENDLRRHIPIFF